MPFTFQVTNRTPTPGPSPSTVHENAGPTPRSLSLRTRTCPRNRPGRPDDQGHDQGDQSPPGPLPSAAQVANIQHGRHQAGYQKAGVQAGKAEGPSHKRPAAPLLAPLTGSQAPPSKIWDKLWELSSISATMAHAIYKQIHRRSKRRFTPGGRGGPGAAHCQKNAGSKPPAAFFCQKTFLLKCPRHQPPVEILARTKQGRFCTDEARSTKCVQSTFQPTATRHCRQAWFCRLWQGVLRGASTIAHYRRASDRARSRRWPTHRTSIARQYNGTHIVNRGARR